MVILLAVSWERVMSTGCGRPQGEGISLMWMSSVGQKPDFIVDIMNGRLLIKDIYWLSKHSLQLGNSCMISLWLTSSCLNYNGMYKMVFNDSCCVIRSIYFLLSMFVWFGSRVGSINFYLFQILVQHQLKALFRLKYISSVHLLW